jgi:hypothetical protein
MNQTRWQRFNLQIVANYALFLVALAVVSVLTLPAPLLASQRFHHDEALYATWALQIVSGHDPWLTQTPLDKPPLFPFVLAGSLSLLGVSETAARIPALLASAGTVILTYWLGRRLYNQGTGVVAAWLVALSPFSILFAPTAFTDPLLVLWVLAACVAAASGRAGWAGVSLGLAVATKQQGVFFGPLMLGVWVIGNWLLVIERRKAAEATSIFTTNYYLLFTNYLPHFLLGLGLTLLPLLIWNFTRSQAPDVFTRSLDNYGGLSLNWAGFAERWLGFIDLLGYGTGSPLLNWLFLGGLPLLLGFGLWRITANPSPPTAPAHQSPSEHTSSTPPLLHHPTPPPLHLSTDWLLTLFSLAFVLLHALLSFQVWDRYLLGLIPLLALLLARILLLPWSILCRWWSDRPPAAGVGYGIVLTLLLAFTFVQPVKDAVNGRYPLGSHSQALSGIEQIVAYLQGHVGADNTLYHHWLGTHWRFYLWGYPYDLQYWATPSDLAAKAKPGHLIAFPSWRSETEARLALAQVGLTLRELTRAHHPAGYPSLVLYQIVTIKQ